MENQRLSIEQKRAKFAFNNRSSGDSSNYDALVKKVASYIQTNGFVYTMAFLAQKKEAEAVFKVIWDWNCNSNENTLRLNDLKNVSKEKFIEVLTQTLEDEQIRLVTLETLALFTWLRRFVNDDEQ